MRLDESGLDASKGLAMILAAHLPEDAQEKSWHIAIFDNNRECSTPASVWRFDRRTWSDNPDMTIEEQERWRRVIEDGTVHFGNGIDT